MYDLTCPKCGVTFSSTEEVLDFQCTACFDKVEKTNDIETPFDKSKLSVFETPKLTLDESQMSELTTSVIPKPYLINEDELSVKDSSSNSLFLGSNEGLKLSIGGVSESMNVIDSINNANIGYISVGKTINSAMNRSSILDLYKSKVK